MPNADELAVITCNGQTYRDWKSVMVERDYGAFSSLFSFGAVEPGAFGQGWAAMRLKPGDAVTVTLAGITVITGAITARSTSIDAQGHELVLQGRSAVANLVDSSVPIKPGTFSGQTYEQVARALLAPHGVGLVIKNPPPIFGKPFRWLVPQYGETVHEMLQRLASMRGVFHTDDAQGNLVVGQGDPSAAPVATLQEGFNIKSATVRLINESAWSKYTAVSQTPGDDNSRPPRDYSGSSVDSTLPAGREKIVISPHPGDDSEMAAHANYLRAIDTWLQVQATITVQGWKRPDGNLWNVTENVSVKAPSLFPNADGTQTLGIQSVRYTQDSENGTLTTLECILPNALTTTPNPHVPTDANGNFTDGQALGTAKPDPSDTST